MMGVEAAGVRHTVYTPATCALLTLVTSPLAAQEDAGRVLIIALEGSRALALGLSGEFTVRGFDVLSEDMSEAPSPEELEELARRREAIATILLRPSGDEVQIWVVDRVTDKIVIRTLTAAEGEDRGILVRRAVEVLRASLLEVQVMPEEELAVPAPPVVREFATPDPPPARWHVHLAPGATWSAGGFGASGILDLRLAWQLEERVGVHALSRIALSPAELVIPQGRVDAWGSSAGLGVWMQPRSRLRALDPYLGVQLEGLRVRVSGQGQGAFVGRAETRWLARWGALAGVKWAINRRIGLTLGLDVSRTSPVLRVDVSNEAVARWGVVTLSGNLGVSLALD